ncbi:sensor histidine kinase [Parafilimonas sp.]|uniref:sensor histidine kinase n=1 Tax=Parafilimonas sp. TaxID=1969739 RepID=UPI0039E2BBA5
MFNTKNLSPDKLSLFTAVCLAVPVSIAFYIISFNWIDALIALAIIFMLAFFLIRFVLNKFIYRKIKVIYKYIYQTKANKREEIYQKYILPKKSIEEVNNDVEKWAEQQAAVIDDLKNNERYRREFLQNLAHEIKTPIFAIQGYVDTLLGGAMENPAIAKKFLENTSRNVTRMVDLVHDLDEITRLESGEQLLHKKKFVMQEVIREVFETLSKKAAEKNIHCSIKKGCEQPVEVFADKEKISRVLINLVDNAIKYGKTDGHVTAGIYNTDEKHILIEISDNGIGIAGRHLSRVFERFYRTDTGRSRNAGGTGLGLAICKHIIEAHNQSIHVRSKENVGTTTGFTLDKR